LIFGLHLVGGPVTFNVRRPKPIPSTRNEAIMATDWSDYQEEAAALFRSMGLDAATNVTVQGVRTTHDVDVVVKSKHAGFEVQWLVECKHWKSPVSKLHVLGLREIVADTGSDRGILLCEAGFQSGAIEAATLTNVQATSLENVRATAGRDLSAMRLRELYDRVELCRARYWNIPKRVRIEQGLRQDVGEWGYSGASTMETCEELINRAFRGVYPFGLDSLQALVAFGKDRRFQSPEEVVVTVEPLVQELESKLTEVEQRAGA
jgi:restriction system protein